MSNSDHTDAPLTLDDLLSQLCDEALTPKNASLLNAMLGADPSARQRYLVYMELHGSLHWNLISETGLKLEEDIGSQAVLSVASGETMVLPAVREADAPDTDDWQSLPDAPKPHAHVARPSTFTRAAWIGIAAAVLISVSVGWRVLSRLPAEMPAAAIASLSGSVKAEWSEPAPRFTSPTTLRSGQAKLRFDNGAEVIVQGPAAFQVISRSEMRLSRGQAVATVGPASRGFTIQTPRARVVDLGTEFGVIAGESGDTEIHVFRGEVTVARISADPARPAAPQSVTGGSAVKVVSDAKGAVPIPVASARFVREGDFEALQNTGNADLVNAAYRRWLTTSLSLRNDPRVMSYYTFDPGEIAGVKSVPNLAGRNPSTDAQIENCGFDVGRFPQKRAVDLHAPAGRVKVYIPGETTQLTLAAWISARQISHRPTANDPFTSPWSSLLMSDGYAPAGGYVHWQLDHGGGLSLSVNHRPPEPNYNSPPVYAAAQLRQWHHLATVYDVPGNRVAFYMDGNLVLTQVPNAASRLTIGQALIGNWIPMGEPANGRSFDGKIDELIAFRAALSDAEIAKMYDDTRPSDAPAAGTATR